MDDGGEFLYNGTAEHLWDYLLNPYSFSDAVRDAVNGAVTWMADDWLENVYGAYVFGRHVAGTILSILQDFVDWLIGFFGKAWQFIKNLMGDMYKVFIMLIYLVPILVIQYAGHILYKKRYGGESDG